MFLIPSLVGSRRVWRPARRVPGTGAARLPGASYPGRDPANRHAVEPGGLDAGSRRAADGDPPCERRVAAAEVRQRAGCSMRNTWWRFAPRSQSKASVARERSLSSRPRSSAWSRRKFRRFVAKRRMPPGASRRRVMRRMRSAWSRWTSKVARPIFLELLKVGGSSQIRSYCPPASATQRRQSACTRVCAAEGPPSARGARRRAGRPPSPRLRVSGFAGPGDQVSLPAVKPLAVRFRSAHVR